MVATPPAYAGGWERARRQAFLAGLLPALIVLAAITVAPALYLSRKDATVLFHPGRGQVQDVYQLSEGRYRRRLRETLNRFWP